MTAQITMTGRLGDNIELRYTPSGKAVANGRIAHTPRRLNPQTQQWEDAGETLWLAFSIWDRKAEALANTAHKGDLVTVVGELTARSYDANDGTKRTVNEIKAREVAVVPRGDAQAPVSQPNSQWGPTTANPGTSGPQNGAQGPWNQNTGTGGWGGTGGFPASTNHDEPPFQA